MAMKFRERIHSPLPIEEARALVDDIVARMDASSLDAEAEAEAAAAFDPGTDGFSLVSERGEDDECLYAALVFDDVDLWVEETKPPTATEARASAKASGTAPSSIVLAPAALSRLRTCRSTITLEYYGRVFDTRPFIAVQKLLFDRVGEAVLSSGDGARLTTVETAAAECAKAVGSLWAETRPLGSREPPPKPTRTRPAKPGELEAASLYESLVALLGSEDSLSRYALKRELERTTEAVRAYAASLMESGPKPDAVIAKSLHRSEVEVNGSRSELRLLLTRIQ